MRRLFFLVWFALPTIGFAENPYPEHFVHVPLTPQSTTYSCGTGALQGFLMFYGFEYKESTLMKEVKTTPAYGTHYKYILEFLDRIGIKAELRKDLEIDDLKDSIDRGHPVLVMLQAWVDPAPKDWNKLWKEGHYSVVVGYDDTKIYFMDPSTIGNYAYIPTKEFLTRWRDEFGKHDKVTRGGIFILNKQPKYQRDKIFKML